MSSKAVEAFERELKNKLEFKASSKVSVDAVLFKSFKFFDLYNHGFLNRADFFKAIAKCGVVVDTHDLDAVYNCYDPNNEGRIDYRNFIENLLFSQKSQTQSSQMNRSQYSQARNSHEEPHKELAQSNFQKSERRSQIASNLSPSEKLKESRYDNFQAGDLNSLEEIIEKIKHEIRGDGISGLLNFANKLKSTDVQRSHLISLQNLGHHLPYLSQNSLHLLISRFNPNKFGEINYAELIYTIKGNMNLQRQSMVDDLFNMLDHEQKGEIELQKVISGFRNRSQIGSLKRAIDSYCRFQSIDDGIFTDEDFNDFFEFVSFSYSVDAAFQEFVRTGFYGEEPARSAISSRSSRREFDPTRRQISEHASQHPSQQQVTGDFRKLKIEEPVPEVHQHGSAYKDLPSDQKHFEDRNQDKKSEVSRSRHSERSHAESSHIKEVNMILMRIRKTLASKGSRGFLHFEKILKNNDTDQDGLLNLDQFRGVIKQQKIDITNVQATNLFGIFDDNKMGKIDYLDFLQTIKGEAPESRRNIFNRMWEKLKLDEEHTDLFKLKTSLNFRNHPDVVTGRKYDDQIWQQIVDTMLIIQELNGQPREERISKDIFMEYCENLSLSISEDSLFEALALNFWKIDSLVKINEQYAGSRKVFDPSKKGYLQDHHKYAVNGGSVSQNAPFGTSMTPTIYETEHQRL